MTVLETLTSQQHIALEDVQNKITLNKLASLKYGDEEKLNEFITLYHYYEEDIIVLCLDYGDNWEEILQILWDREFDEIIFEAL